MASPRTVEREPVAARSPLPIVVSRSSYESDDPYSLIGSNIDVVHSLRGEYLRDDEISDEALQSYYVDYYVAQVSNGGFSQFVYNSGWRATVVDRVRRGLRSMNARRHAELFERSAAEVDGLGAEGLARFLEGEYFGEENFERDVLNAHDEAFFALMDEEDPYELNARWIRSRPDIRVLGEKELEEELRRRAAQVPDRAARVAEARANAPRYAQLVQQLCDAAGHELDRITAGDPTHVHEGTPVLAWHFLTDRGHYYMVDLGDRALMFDDSSDELVAEVAAEPQ